MFIECFVAPPFQTAACTIDTTNNVQFLLHLDSQMEFLTVTPS